MVLGPSEGWHADQLRAAAKRHAIEFQFAGYETLAASVGGQGDSAIGRISFGGKAFQGIDAVLTRTMPWASMERITFRLAALHALADGELNQRPAVVNGAIGLERCIDKYATLLRLAAAGYPTPATRVVQSRTEAMDAFAALGEDCVVKPIFGGEGRGVMRVTDRELAWYTFSSLDRLDATILIQEFVRPGGKDRRLLVVGDHVFGVRRCNSNSFRSNVAAGGTTEAFEVGDSLAEEARSIAKQFNLVYGAIDLVDNESGPDLYLEINAIPGWKGAQQVIGESIADCLIDAINTQADEVTG